MFDSLEHDLKELRELDLRGLSAEEKDEAIVAWARLRNQVDAFDAALLAAWESEKSWMLDGSRSAAAWLSATANPAADPPTAARATDESRRCRSSRSAAQG